LFVITGANPGFVPADHLKRSESLDNSEDEENTSNTANTETADATLLGNT